MLLFKSLISDSYTSYFIILNVIQWDSAKSIFLLPHANHVMFVQFFPVTLVATCLKDQFLPYLETSLASQNCKFL